MTFATDTTLDLDTDATTTEAAPAPAAERLFAVRSEDFAEVHARTAKLNKRASKLGADAVSVVEVRREIRPVRDSEGRKLHDYFGNPITAEWVLFRIDGARPKADGWSLAARFDHSADLDAPVIKAVPSAGELAPEYRTNERTRTCEHCRAARRRKDTFLVRHDDGREMVVGRQCIADFLGHDLAKLVPFCDAVIEMCDEFEGGFGGRGEIPVMLVTFITLALADIRLNGGFVSRKMVQEGGRHHTTTAAAAWHLATKLRCDLKIEERAFIEQAQQFAPLASTVIEWCKAEYEAPRNDFEHNLRLASGCTQLPHTLSGVAAYLPVAWSKANEARVAKAARPASTHVGEIGKRIELGECEVFLVRYLDGDFGTRTLVKARTASGAVLTWFASGSIEANAGDVVSIKATIKKHESYQGEAQTVIQRAVLTPVKKEG